jgi:hypothetical protein
MSVQRDEIVMSGDIIELMEQIEKEGFTISRQITDHFSKVDTRTKKHVELIPGTSDEGEYLYILFGERKAIKPVTEIIRAFPKFAIYSEKERSTYFCPISWKNKYALFALPGANETKLMLEMKKSPVLRKIINTIRAGGVEISETIYNDRTEAENSGINVCMYMSIQNLAKKWRPCCIVEYIKCNLELGGRSVVERAIIDVHGCIGVNGERKMGGYVFVPPEFASEYSDCEFSCRDKCV